MKPDYENSIVNLTSSVVEGLGGEATYPFLEDLPPEVMEDYENVVLVLADGMGYNFLKKKRGFLHDHLRTKLTSVLPPSTTSCIPVFATGLPPQQHALTGWFMYWEEVDKVMIPLRFVERGSEDNLTVDSEDLFDQETIYESLKSDSYIVTRREYLESEYTKAYSKGADVIGYDDLEECFQRINECLERPGRKLVYSYLHDIDHLAHKHGIRSEEVAARFERIDELFRDFIASKGDDTLVLVTADHGLVDVAEENIVKVEDHPRLKECLRLPLSGDARMAYCYMKEGKESDFEEYVEKNLSDKCSLFRSEDLVDENYFGLYEPNLKLSQRIGDYVLLMNERYAIIDLVPGEEKGVSVGRHGGLSEEELFVPLIVFP